MSNAPLLLPSAAPVARPATPGTLGNAWTPGTRGTLGTAGTIPPITFPALPAIPGSVGARGLPLVIPGSGSDEATDAALSDKWRRTLHSLVQTLHAFENEAGALARERERVRALISLGALPADRTLAALDGVTPVYNTGAESVRVLPLYPVALAQTRPTSWGVTVASQQVPAEMVIVGDSPLLGDPQLRMERERQAAHARRFAQGLNALSHPDEVLISTARIDPRDTAFVDDRDWMRLIRRRPPPQQMPSRGRLSPASNATWWEIEPSTPKPMTSSSQLDEANAGRPSRSDDYGSATWWRTLLPAFDRAAGIRTDEPSQSTKSPAGAPNVDQKQQRNQKRRPIPQADDEANQNEGTDDPFEQAEGAAPPSTEEEMPSSTEGEIPIDMSPTMRANAVARRSRERGDDDRPSPARETPRRSVRPAIIISEPRPRLRSRTNGKAEPRTNPGMLTSFSNWRRDANIAGSGPRLFPKHQQS